MTRTARAISTVLFLTWSLTPPDAYAQYADVTSGTTDAAAHQTFNFMGFGDISYVSRDNGNPGGFVIGQAVAHVTASIDDSLRVFGEFSMTAKDAEYKTSVERLIVRYDFSDTFKVSAGRYHTPIGYWNSAYHHGAWLQTTVSRPEMAKFGSTIMPIHFVGALLEGTVPRNKLGLFYKAGFGNGRHENIAQAGDAGDINGDNAWMVELGLQPTRIFGLKTGIGFYSDRVTPADRPEVNEQIFSSFLVWDKQSPEIILEYLHSEHDQVIDSNVNGNIDAWYAQFAYRLKNKLKDFKPYARVERTRVEDSDPLLGDQGLDYDAAILGIRWDFSSYAALKGEFRNEEFDGNGRENNFRLQVSFALADL